MGSPNKPRSSVISFGSRFMKVYHISVEREGKWFCATAMENPSVFTQGRSLDDIVENIREVADLLHGEKKCRSN